MRTIKSTLNGVISGNASKELVELPAKHSDRSEQPETHSEMVADPSSAPAERPDMNAAPVEAAAELPGTLSGSKKASAMGPTIHAASKRAAGSPPTILSGSKKASASPPTILSHPEKASTSPPTILSNPKNASAVASTVLANPRNASGDDFEHAYQSLLPELCALRRSQVMPINIGITGAVTKALRIQPTLATLMDRIAEVASGVDPRLPERLVTHALALSHAHALFVTTSQGVDALPSLSEELCSFTIPA